MSAVKPTPIPASLAGHTSGSEAAFARDALYFAALMREVEERIERKLYRQGKILGGVYVGRGQEAICVGAGLAALPGDVLFPCHRDLGLYLIRGVPARQIIAQYMGRIGGMTRGKDGNMHMGDMKLRIVAIISAMAASVPVACGAAMSFQYRGTKDVALCFFGDGATSRGDWHEGLNMASVLKAPVVYICNNNGYAYSTPNCKEMACENVADRAAAYNMPGEIVDGNDVFAVNASTQRAIDRARAGAGPSLIECKTFRMTGHSAHDPADYVPKHMFEDWQSKDPIQFIEKRILKERWGSQKDIDSVHARIRAEVDEAIEWAEKSAFPDVSELGDNVYEQAREN